MPRASTNRALVLGTSNSILRDGWVDGLRAGYRGEVVNASIGATACCNVLWQIAQRGPEDLDGFDWIFVDTLVNDENFIQRGFLDAAWARWYQDEILRGLPAPRVIFVAFSMMTRFHEGSEISAYQERRAAAAGATFVSVRRMLRRAMTTAGGRRAVDLDDVYGDPGHVHRHLARLFGQRLGGWLNARSVSDAAAPTGPFALSAPAAGRYPSLERTTSLRHEITQVLGEGDVIELPPNRMVHGVCVNATNTNCSLEVSAGELRLSKQLGYQLDGEKMQVKFVHFREPFATPEAGGRMTVSSKSAHRRELGVHSKALEPVGRLELLSVLTGPLPRPEPLPAPPREVPEQSLSALELELMRGAGLARSMAETVSPPEYPRSWIEL